MRAAPCTQHPLRKCFLWTLKKSAMLHLVIDFLRVLGEAPCKGIQRPDSQALWIDLIGHLSGNFASLRITSKLIQQLGVCFPKKALDNRPKAWLLCGTIQLRDKAPSQQRLKVDAAKLWAAIYH